MGEGGEGHNQELVMAGGNVCVERYEGEEEEPPSEDIDDGDEDEDDEAGEDSSAGC